MFSYKVTLKRVRAVRSERVLELKEYRVLVLAEVLVKVIVLNPYARELTRVKGDHR